MHGSVKASGSIPACTGEPLCAGLIKSDGHKGLSPRVRGNLPAERPDAGTFESGSIPACTGEPHWRVHCTYRWMTSAVYPRVYGGTLHIMPRESNLA